jgi:hypothetical protein
MIANTLIFPTERPPSIDDLKRALLTFDQVYLYAPDDRDLLPSEFYQMAAFGMPVGFGGVPVRPLGKVEGYNDGFQELLDECKPALAQESLKVLPSAARPVDTTLQTSSLVLGFPPAPPNVPNPAFLLHVFRALAASPRLVAGIGRGLDTLPPISDENIDRLVPKGIDDQQWTFQIAGVTPQVTLPAPALYDGFAHTDEERIALTRACLARLAALVRAMAHCDLLNLEPYLTDVGYMSVVHQLGANSREVAEESAPGDAADNTLQVARRLSRLHNLVVAEFLDTEALAQSSVSDILKLRTRAWGTAGEHRDRLARHLRQLGTEARSDDEFDRSCREALEEYRRARAEWDNEASQLRIKLLADLGRVTLGGIGGQLGGELAQKYVHLGSLEALLIVGGMIFLKAVGERGPELQALLHRRRERENLPGCALAKPYTPFLSTRRRAAGS